MANSVCHEQTALYEYFHLDLHYSQRHLSGYLYFLAQEKKQIPTEIVCSGANKHFLKDGLKIALYFTHPYLYHQLNLLIYLN